jgi:hypothetical protein
MRSKIRQVTVKSSVSQASKPVRTMVSQVKIRSKVRQVKIKSTVNW